MTTRHFRIDGSDVLFLANHWTLWSRDEDGLLRIHLSLLLEACGVPDSEIRKEAEVVIQPQVAWSLAHNLMAAVTEMPAFDIDRQP